MRGGQAFAGGARDGKGGIALAAGADARIGGGVFYEYRSFHRLGKAGEVVDVF